MKQVFPDTRFVVLLRDPRDVLCSFRAFGRKPHVMAENPFMTRTLPLDDFCTYYRSLYESAINYLHPHVVVRYEDLVAEPTATVEVILKHLGLQPADREGHAIDGDPAKFARHATSESVGGSVGRWSRDLPPAEQRDMENRLGDFLQTYGYGRTQ